jgi:hypothetical protein
MDQEDDFMAMLFEDVAMHLLAVGTDDFGEKDFEGCNMGELMHLRLRDMKGEVCLEIVGGQRRNR